MSTFERSGSYIIGSDGLIRYDIKENYILDRSGRIVFEIKSDGTVVDRYGNYVGTI